MSILAATRFLIMPLLLWRAKRRSIRDNQMTLDQLEELHELLTKSPKP